MIKLTKTAGTQWNGNGFGVSSAEWVIKGAEHIAVRKLCGNWYAIDINTNRKIARGFDRAMLLEVLESNGFHLVAENGNELGK